MNPTHHKAPSLLSLPSELRTSILEYVFASSPFNTGLVSNSEGVCTVNHSYSAAKLLSPLLACKQLYYDARLLALTHTHFLVTNLYINVPERLSRLSSKQLDALRSIAIISDTRHFRNLKNWDSHAFSNPALNLDALTIVLHQSSHHYLFDFTADVAKLLRRLQGVKSLVFVRNHAHVKGAFKTWCNRLIGLIMKIDHYERYDAQPRSVETTWWKWTFHNEMETFTLEALPSKAIVEEETYMQQIKPLMEELMLSIESEEWNPDPRARNGT